MIGIWYEWYLNWFLKKLPEKILPGRFILPQMSMDVNNERKIRLRHLAKFVYLSIII